MLHDSIATDYIFLVTRQRRLRDLRTGMSALRGIISVSLRASRAITVRYGGSHAAPQATITTAKGPLVSFTPRLLRVSFRKASLIVSRSLFGMNFR